VKVSSTVQCWKQRLIWRLEARASPISRDYPGLAGPNIWRAQILQVGVKLKILVYIFRPTLALERSAR